VAGSSVKDTDNWRFCYPAPKSFSPDRVINTYKVLCSVVEMVLYFNSIN